MTLKVSLRRQVGPRRRARSRGLPPMIMALALALAAGCTQVKPDEIGVRTINFGASKGIVERDYGPGYHRYLWPLDTWHRFPSTIQQIRFTHDPASARQRGTALTVISADGDRVTINAEIMFRIAEDRANKVLQDSGSGDRYLAVVRNLSQDVARVVLGRLRTEDFYNEARREEARRAGRRMLAERLAERGIELVDLLIESIQFEPGYEALIRQKKIADQRVELERAQAAAQEERGKVDLIRAQTTAMLQQIRREADAKVMEIETGAEMEAAAIKAEAAKYAAQRGADGELYFALKQAEGQRLTGKAEAEGTRLVGAALDGEGARNLVAMEALRKLNLVEVAFPSLGFEWFNPYAMAERVGADGVAVPAAEPEAAAAGEE